MANIAKSKMPVPAADCFDQPERRAITTKEIASKAKNQLCGLCAPLCALCVKEKQASEYRPRRHNLRWKSPIQTAKPERVAKIPAQTRFQIASPSTDPRPADPVNQPDRIFRRRISPPRHMLIRPGKHQILLVNRFLGRNIQQRHRHPSNLRRCQQIPNIDAPVKPHQSKIRTHRIVKRNPLFQPDMRRPAPRHSGRCEIVNRVARRNPIMRDDRRTPL